MDFFSICMDEGREGTRRRELNLNQTAPERALCHQTDLKFSWKFEVFMETWSFHGNLKFCHFAGEDPGIKIEELADPKLVIYSPPPPHWQHDGGNDGSAARIADVPDHLHQLLSVGADAAGQQMAQAPHHYADPLGSWPAPPVCARKTSRKTLSISPRPASSSRSEPMHLSPSMAGTKGGKDWSDRFRQTGTPALADMTPEKGIKNLHQKQGKTNFLLR